MSYSYRTLSESYATFRLRLVSGMLTLALLALGVVAWKIYSSYEDEQNAIRSQAQTFVRAMEAHVSHSIELADLSLTGIANGIRQLPQEKINSADLVEAVASFQGFIFNPDFWILFIDANGIGVAATNDIAVRGVSYADRDYFKVHALAKSDTGLYVGQPDVDKVSKRRLFFVSRRVVSAEGKFLGVIAAPMDASRFAAVFESARFSDDVAVTLLHTSGKVIARSPDFEQSFAVSLVKTPLFDHLRQAPAGWYQATSAIDHRPRIYSYHTLDHLPLVVGVGIGSDAWNKVFRNDFLIGGVGILMMTITMFWSGHLALNAYGRLHGSESRYRKLYTDVQAAEDKLSRSENRLRTITDNLPVLISYIDNEQIMRFCNGTFELWFGVSPAAMMDRPLIDIIGVVLYEQRRANLERALSGERVEFEMESATLGVLRFLHTTYIPDKAGDGSIAGVYALSTDVTELKRSERRVRAIADNMPALIAHIDAQERYVFCNQCYSTVPDIDADHMIGKTMREVFGNENYEQVAVHVAAVLTGQRVSFERSVERDGIRNYLQYEYVPEIDASGQTIGFYTMVTDTSAYKQAELKIAAGEKQLRAVTNHTPALISFIDPDGRFQFNNAHYEKILRRPLAEITGKKLADVFGEASYARYRPYFDTAINGERCDFEFESDRVGSKQYYKATYVPLFDDDGKVTGICSLVHDITSLKNIERQLSTLARFDSLTGLPNRNQLHERLTEAIVRGGRSGVAMAVLFLDIDYFKTINDTLGHHGGDLVLKEFGRRLKTCVRESDIVARLAGDEFVIVLEGLHQATESELVAAKIIQAMQNAFDVEGVQRNVTTSIGIAVRHLEKTDTETMLRKADEALYRAKTAGRNTYATIML